MQKAFDDIHMEIYCIGGPLNDSRVAYTKKQLKPFFIIGSIADRFGRQNDDGE